MTLSILSSRAADPNIDFSFTFTVSSGPPSHLECKTGNTQVFSGGGQQTSVTREVIRSRYINSSLPDMTRVTIQVPAQPRIGRTYECIVSVRSLENIGRENTNSVQHGQGSSTITVTGKYTGIHIEL